MNSIDAKQYNFLQQNLPGNDAYGQTGAQGNTGIDGNSIYFTPYILNTVEGRNSCEELIKTGKELSNNEFYNNKNVTYKTNDLIIDKLGDVYILRIADKSDSEEIILESIFYLNNIFSQGTITDSLQCILKCDEAEDSSVYFRKQPNNAYLGEYDIKTSSPYFYHRDRYIKRLCGSWLYFSINVPESDYGNFIYKYTLLFPNGQKLEKLTENTSCEIFVDNRYIYSCRPSNSTITILKQLFSSNKEYEYSFSKLIANYIAEECKAYVEISDKESHNIYRVYADEIQQPETNNSDDNNYYEINDNYLEIDINQENNG